MMLKEIHEHVVSELQQNARTDTVFVVTAIVFNLIVLGINWAVAAAASSPRQAENDAVYTVILVMMIIATLFINTFAVRALMAGRNTRAKLLAGLIAMYQDNQVDKYYDPSLLDTYGTRYKLFMAVLGCLAAIAIVVPLLQKFMG